MDVVMNHPGYATLVDLQNLVASGSGDLISGSTINYKSHEWHNWWGVDWVRAGFCSHYKTGTGELKGSCGGSLPDFITESGKGVELSPMFTHKLADTTNYPREGYKVTDLTNDDSEAGNYRMRDYLIKWLSSWVREFGIDGFRCDTAKHVEKEAWYQLKVACIKALRDWKSANPDKKVDDSDFWMTGEHFGHGVEKDAYFTDGGFDSMINFSFRAAAGSALSDIKKIESTYDAYAKAINDDLSFNMLSYISSHDTGAQDEKGIFYSDYASSAANQKKAGSLLAFCPGAIQIYYGDECGRKNSNITSGEKTSDNKDQAARSQMPWDEDGYRSAQLGYDFDSDIHAHWSKVLNFRKNHVAIGAGTHSKIADAPYTFSRVKGDDKVIVVLGASTGPVEVNVSSIFEDGTTLHDAYANATATVTDGKATFTADSNGVILIEKAE
jgi:alpha-amylase